MPRRWQLKLENGVPIDVETNAGGGWIVTAAGAVRTTNHDLERALQELVGPLVDTAWINAESRLIETHMHSRAGPTGGDRGEGGDPARQGTQRTRPARRQAPP